MESDCRIEFNGYIHRSREHQKLMSQTRHDIKRCIRKMKRKIKVKKEIKTVREKERKNEKRKIMTSWREINKLNGKV